MSKIILDPTGLYQPQNNYTIITTEVEWLQYFTLEHENYWIKGKMLCHWTEEWLKVWNKLDLIIEIKQQPLDITDNDIILEKSDHNNNYKPRKNEEVIVNCIGKCEGEKPAKLTITIYNYDIIPLKNLCLYIHELPDFKNGKMLDISIEPNDKFVDTMLISQYPKLPPDKNKTTIKLSGKLTFTGNNDDLEESHIDSNSFITIKQIYNSGFQGDLDDF